MSTRMLDSLSLSKKQIISIGKSQERVNLWDGSIRSGKTISSLLRWLMFVAEAPKGGELLMVGKTVQTVHRNLFLPLQNPDLFGGLSQHINYTSGSPFANILGRRIHVMGANDAKAETKLRGMTLAGAYVDEVTLVQEAFWNQLLGRMSVEEAKLFATTNPDNPAHWLNKNWIQKKSALPMRSWHFTLDDNKSLDPAYVASIKAMYTGLYFRRFVLGEWVAADGAIFDMWDPQIHVTEKFPRIHRWLCVGIDYGTTNPFSALLLGLGDDRKLYVMSEYRYDSREKRRQKTDAQYSREIRAWLENIPGYGSVKPQFFLVDPSAASFKTQLRQDNFSAQSADNDVVDGIRTVSSLLANEKLLIHQSCEGLLAEIPSYVWDEKAALLGEDKPVKQNDHSCDALRYACFSTRALWRNAIRLAA